MDESPSAPLSRCVANREMTLRKFGRSLASRRKALGLTQEEVAEKCGLHPNYIGGLERGERNPTLLTLLALAPALKCRPGDLLDG